MTLESFKSLTKKQQRRALLQKGVFLADRTTASFSVFLFQMGDFFVELFFVRENDEIVGMRLLEHLHSTKRYAAAVQQLEQAAAA